MTTIPRQLLTGHLSRAAANGDLVFTAVTAGAKRDGLEIDIAGMRTDNFLKNPVFLWVHDYMGNNPPIGKVVSLEKIIGALVATVRFDLTDPFAAKIPRKYLAGFLNAVSVGWETLKVDGAVVVESDLLDISAVLVPGDPEALMMRAAAYARGLRVAKPIDLPTDSPPGVSGGPGRLSAVINQSQGDIMATNSRASVEQLDAMIDALQSVVAILMAWRDEIAAPAEEPESEPAALSKRLAELLGAK